ncbi:hypothetical protein [Roseateles flavus]|uniref:Uncharacterized protein n=1 Tax=Roseateles flavus TaxID=3149041 RepID=A0ABV0GDQ7_9BURK
MRTSCNRVVPEALCEHLQACRHTRGARHRLAGGAHACHAFLRPRLHSSLLLLLLLVTAALWLA